MKYKAENLVRIEKINNKEIAKILPDETSQKIENILIDDLVDYKSNPFSKLSGENYEHFKESIRINGIINPLTVRKTKNDKYEIISGHNRKRAAYELQMKTVPAVVVEADDIKASVMLYMSNIQRENVTDYEKAIAFRNTYEAMILKSGERTDLTSPQTGTRVRTDEVVAELYGISKNTFRRKMRLAYLVPQLAELYLNKKITQEQAENLSYLKFHEQHSVVSSIQDKNCKMTLDIAKKLRKESEQREEIINIDEIFNMTKNIDEKSEIKVRKYKIKESLFPKEIKIKDRVEFIEKALRYYKENLNKFNL